MKYFLMLLSFVCILSCNSCANKTIMEGSSNSADEYNGTVVAEKNDVTNHRTLYLGTMEFMIHNDWNLAREVDNELILVNMDKRNLIVLAKENCELSFNDCIYDTMRDIPENGVEILKMENSSIDGKDFLLVTSREKGTKVWSWITHYKDTTYLLSCGGLEDEKYNKDFCFELSKTIKLR